MPVPVDLSKLSDLLKNYDVKKTEYDKLVAKVNGIDTNGFVLKTKYDTDKSELENNISDTSGLVKKTDFDTKIAEIESKIPDVTNLATKIALTTIENKIPDVSSLVKKRDYNIRVAEINTKLSSLDGKIVEKKTKNESIKNELEKATKNLLLFFLGNTFCGARDGSQAYLIFQPLHRYVKIIANTKYISEWKSKGLSDESIKPPTTSDNTLTPLIDYYSCNIRVKFNGSILR